VTEQIIEPKALPAESHAAETHAHHGHSPEEIRKEIRVYLWVFGGLTALTALTVWACYGLKMPVHKAIAIALAIATAKGFLVAGFFMHLLSEKKLIYSILLLTVFFFAVVIWGPLHHWADMIGR